MKKRKKPKQDKQLSEAAMKCLMEELSDLRQHCSTAQFIEDKVRDTLSKLALDLCEPFRLLRTALYWMSIDTTHWHDEDCSLPEKPCATCKRRQCWIEEATKLLVTKDR